jgi:Pin2-interacting protein X1
MGWQQGKGLGANEDGIKENIKVKFKCDTKGVGFSNNEYENVWLEHQDDFEQLLSSLKQTSETTQASVDEQVEHGKNQAVQPLEAKSKESRARLHYKKFTKSKDLSTASANDLKCILGTEKRQKSKHQANEQPNSNGKSGSNAETETEDDVDQFRVSFKMSTSETNANGTLEKNLSENSAFQTNKKSISEYFASKMAYRFVKANNETEKKEEQVDELINEEERELQIRIEQSETSEDKNQVDEEESKKKKKKKKKSKKRSRTEDEDIEEVKEEAKTASFEVEERLEVEFEPTLAKPAEHIQRESDMFFKGSNFFKLNGYSAYIINSELEKVMEEKIKRVGRKRFQMEKILQVDSKFYEMNKKKAC